MQETTPIAASDQDQITAHATYVILGSTSNSEVSVLLELLSSMGGRTLSPAETQRWRASLADSDNVIATVEKFEKERGTAGKPLLLPTTFEVDMEWIHSAMAKLDDLALMMFYSRPEPQLMQALADDLSPSGALEKWCMVARDMLEVIHRHRKRAVLFDVESAFIGSASFKSVCQRQFGLEGDFGNKVAATTHESVAELHRLIAAQMVAQSPDVQDLLHELEASAMPSDLLPVVPYVNCEAALAESRTKGNSDQLKQENELLLLQLHQVQEELENYCLQLRESEKKFESNVRTSEALCAKITELQRSLAETQYTLTRIRQSLSWKLTKPLRGVRAFLNQWPGKQADA